MPDKHANMPGMGEQAKKPARGQSPVKTKKAPKSKPSEGSTHHDKAGHDQAPPKS